MIGKTMFKKVYFLLVIIFMSLMCCFGVLIYQNTARTIKTQLGNKCVGIASAVAVLIEEDIEGFIEFSQTLDIQSDYYNTIRPKLMRIRSENHDNITFLYVQMRISETEVMYILDSELENDPLFSHPGRIDAIMPPEIEAYRLQKPYAPDEFMLSNYGNLMTCFVPLHNPATGEFLALVGVDVSIDQYRSVIKNQLVILVMSVGLFILVLVLSLSLSSGQIERLVARDNLTGVYNKASFVRNLRQQLKDSKRKGKGNSVTIFMADLDHFKKINDTYGHVFGDVVLKTVAQTINKMLRKVDCFARYGGEEFVAYLPDTSIENAESIVERIRLAIENTVIHNVERDIDVKITISIGVAEFNPALTIQEGIELADKALYQAKRPRNSIAVYKADTKIMSNL